MAQTTKLMMAYALVELLKTKPLSKITINDIAEKCGINRMTFYYHFKDIYELVSWTFMEKGVLPLEKNINESGWPERMRIIMESIQENKVIINNIYSSMRREHIEAYIIHLCGKLFNDTIDKMAEGMDITEEDKKFVSDFYNRAFCGFVLNWIEGGMKANPPELIKKLSCMLDGNMEFSLKNMQRNHTKK